MASMTIRNLAQETKAMLARQAADTGQSLEAFVRTLLDSQAARGVSRRETFAEWHARVIAPAGLDDTDLDAFARNIAMAEREEDDDTPAFGIGPE